MYQKKAGLASRNIVHLQKNQKIILRCVGLCFYFLQSLQRPNSPLFLTKVLFKRDFKKN